MSWPKLTPPWNAPTKPLPVLVPEDIAALARIERALAIIRTARLEIVADRLTAGPEALRVFEDYMNTMLDLTNALEIRR